MKELRSKIPKVCKRVRGFGNRSGASPLIRFMKGCRVTPSNGVLKLPSSIFEQKSRAFLGVGECPI